MKPLKQKVSITLDEDVVAMFDAVGMAVEDIACGIYLYEQAAEA